MNFKNVPIRLAALERRHDNGGRCPSRGFGPADIIVPPNR
jgi:hypothetical protein